MDLLALVAIIGVPVGVLVGAVGMQHLEEYLIGSPAAEPVAQPRSGATVGREVLSQRDDRAPAGDYELGMRLRSAPGHEFGGRSLDLADESTEILR